jgi:hypothetical protein
MIYRFLGLFTEVRVLRNAQAEFKKQCEEVLDLRRRACQAEGQLADGNRTVDVLRGQVEVLASKILAHLVQPSAPAPEQPPVEPPVSEPPDSSPPVWEQLEKRNGDWVRVGFVREHSHAWHHVMRSPKMALRSPAGEIHEGVQ